MRLVDRFEAKYIPEPNSGCWLWIGAANSDGYAQISRGGKTVAAHIVSYEVYKGSIPEGLEVDHLCRNRSCVNPDHLEAVIHKENVKRGNNSGALSVRTNKCKNGHEFTEENTGRCGNFPRYCRACHNQRDRVYYWRRKVSQ